MYTQQANSVISRIKLSFLEGLAAKNITWLSLAAFSITTIFTLLVLSKHNWDAKAFIMEGTLYSRSDPSGTIGYDGQFAYYIAQRPLDAAGRLDRPAYRYQRILYPLLAWALSLGGQPALLPWVLLAINLLAVSLACGFIAEMLASRGAPAWLGATFVFYAGTLVAVRADLNEPLAICLALLGTWWAGREAWGRAGLAFALALLAKETAAVFALGAAAWLLWQRRYRAAAGLLLASLLPAVLWGLALAAWLGQSPLAAPEAALEWLPFYGLRDVSLSPARAYILLWVAFPALVFGLLGLVDLARGKASLETTLLLANAALVAFMPRLTWINVAGGLRAATGLAAVSLIYLAAKRSRLFPWAAAFWMVSGLLILPALIE